MKKKLTIELSEDTHTRLKMAAITQKTTMRRLLTECVEKVIRCHERQAEKDQDD